VPQVGGEQCAHGRGQPLPPRGSSREPARGATGASRATSSERIGPGPVPRQRPLAREVRRPPARTPRSDTPATKINLAEWHRRPPCQMHGKGRHIGVGRSTARPMRVTPCQDLYSADMAMLRFAGI
jgi:hypothetical protein